MMPRKSHHHWLNVLIALTLLGSTIAPASAQKAAPRPAPTKPSGFPFFPNFTITIKPSAPEPQATPQTPAKKPVAKPSKSKKPKPPVFRNDIPEPKPRPLLTLDRPAFLNAPRKPDTIVVIIEDGDTTITDIASAYDLKLIDRTRLALLDADIAVLATAEGKEIDPIVAKLIADKRILGAQPDYLFELQGDQTTAQTQELSAIQYAPQRMNTAKAHALTKGENTITAIIDTGMDNAHRDFTNLKFTELDLLPSPATTPGKHGTAITGLVAAQGTLQGIAPATNILSVRAFAEDESGKFLSDSYTLARAIDQSVGAGAQVLNMSFAGPADPILLKMLDKLSDRAIIVVAAAGNNGPGAPAAYPAAHPYAIAVTATDVNDALYTHANRGIYIDVAAPGVDVMATTPGNKEAFNTGTSVATAHMSGVIALMLSKAPNLTATQILNILAHSTTDLGTPGADPEYGQGLIDAYRATAIAAEFGG